MYFHTNCINNTNKITKKVRKKGAKYALRIYLSIVFKENKILKIKKNPN
jgi:hypothetical protein